MAAVVKVWACDVASSRQKGSKVFVCMFASKYYNTGAVIAIIGAMSRGLFAAGAMMCALFACRKPAPKIVVPEVFRVKFETSQGDFVVEAARAWAPRGVDRFHELLRMRYFDQARFFRVIPGFIAQFGVHRISKCTECGGSCSSWTIRRRRKICGARWRSRSPVRIRGRRRFLSAWRITRCSTGRGSCRL